MKYTLLIATDPANALAERVTEGPPKLCVVVTRICGSRAPTAGAAHRASGRSVGRYAAGEQPP